MRADRHTLKVQLFQRRTIPSPRFCTSDERSVTLPIAALTKPIEELTVEDLYGLVSNQIHEGEFVELKRGLSTGDSGRAEANIHHMLFDAFPLNVNTCNHTLGDLVR